MLMMDECYSPVWWIQKEEEQDLCLRSLLIYTQCHPELESARKNFFFLLWYLPTAQPWWGSQLCPTTLFTAPLKALFCIFGIITSRNTSTGYWKTDAAWIGQLMGCVQKFCETLDTVSMAMMLGSLFSILLWQPTTTYILSLLVNHPSHVTTCMMYDPIAALDLVPVSSCFGAIIFPLFGFTA